MSSKPLLNLPPVGAIKDPAVVSAMQAISNWARNVSSTMLTAGDLDGGPQSLIIQRITRAAESAVATSVRKSRYVPIQKLPANIVREIIENSGTEPPMVFNAPHVFQAGGSTSGVFLGAGGIYGHNDTYIVAGNTEGITFGITAADGSFFFGPRVIDTDPDPERRQIIFDAATGVFQFGQDIVVQYSGGTKTLGDIAASTGYNSADLQADLTAGVNRILSGFGTGYIADFNPEMAYIVMGREGGVYNGYSSIADTTDTNLPALAITAAGIAMGYNRGTDGMWVDGVAILADGTASFSGAINATSGNFTGTVTAGSIVAGGATINGAGGDVTFDALIASQYTSADLSSDIASGINNIIATSSASTTKLEITSAHLIAADAHAVYSGYSAWADTNNTRVCALAIGAGGLFAGYNDINGAWVNSISIDASTGTASFSGAINATSGNFTGTVTAGAIIAGTAHIDSVAGSTVSNLGNTALWGSVSSRPANIAALTGTEAILNSQITISGGAISGIGSGNGTAVANSSITVQSNGVLIGGGGGQVTIGGLGYTGALDATRNTVSYSSVAPSSPINGDLWCDTSVNPNLWKIRVSGAWQTGANNITTSTPVANYIAASSITADRLSVTSLSAISANLGTITAGSLSSAVIYSGSIAAGQITAGTLSAAVTQTNKITLSGTNAAIAYGKTSSADGTTAGFWLGSDGSTPYDFRIGNSTNELFWDGSAGSLSIKSSAYVSISTSSGIGGKAIEANSSALVGYGVYATASNGTGVYGSGASQGGYFTATSSSGIAVKAYCTGAYSYGGDFTGTYADINCAGSKKIAFGSSTRYIRYDGNAFRLSDAYCTDAWLLMITTATGASSTGATLAAKHASAASSAQAGWLTVKVNGATAYVPFWQ